MSDKLGPALAAILEQSITAPARERGALEQDAHRAIHAIGVAIQRAIKDDKPALVDIADQQGGTQTLRVGALGAAFNMRLLPYSESPGAKHMDKVLPLRRVVDVRPS